MPTSITWPVDLPQSFLQSSFRFSPQGNTIRTDMDSGPAKIRKLFTAVSDDYVGEMVLTSAQVTTFKTFFETTISYGSLSFNFPNPFDLLSTLEVRFKIDTKGAPYNLAVEGTTLDWRISIALESIP